MEYSKKDLEEAHKLSYANKLRLKNATRCGCFYCLKFFSPKEIIDWSLDIPDETAICPYCGIDSVLGDNEGFPMTEEFMEEMYEEWFGD